MYEDAREYRQYLRDSGYTLHHIASCRTYDYYVDKDSYTSVFYSGKFGTGFKLMTYKYSNSRYLTVEYWIMMGGERND